MYLDEDKILKMFHIVYGELESKFTVEVDQNTTVTQVHLIKNDHIAWSVTIGELVFEYITREWE